MFRYPNALDRDSCVFVLIYVLVFLVDGLEFGRWNGDLRFLIVIFGARRSFVLADVTICLFDQAIYFADVSFEVFFALFPNLKAQLAYLLSALPSVAIIGPAAIPPHTLPTGFPGITK